MGGLLFGFIGAVTRWIYGTTWRSIARKKKFKFREYLNGPDNSDNIFDNTGHEVVNNFVGLLVLMGIILLILYFDL